ncbi:MAG: glycoside hydrolase family 2 [Propionibacterium sp.]|nr:glycoside hydrolase family 2 [Propionibacterium sp.]
MASDAVRLTSSAPASRQDGSHPRPQLLRSHHVGLDRKVGFAHDDDLVGLDEHWQLDPSRFTRTILLPFPPESAASGVSDNAFHPCVWYRIPVAADELVAAGHTSGRRLLLHFGGVDHEAVVFVDGHRVGEHVGGQAAFSLDITGALDPDATEHVIVVRALDDPLDTRVPRGKQDWMERPHAIWYHRSTGIWRTVWLESVPPLHVTHLNWQGDVSHGRVTALIELNRRPPAATTVSVAIAHDGRLLADATVTMSDQSTEVVLPLTGQDNGVNYERLLWSPTHPVLLDAGVLVHAGDGVDEVRSYLGLRDVAVGPDRLRLNFRPIIVRAVLEQGYWPGSHFTAPSVDAMRAEVQLMLDLGFNCARIHQKVEDQRFVFWADKLGLMLWSETAAAYAFDARAVQLLTAEWVDLVRQYASHPSIVAWVPFNESWGITHLSHDPAQQAYSRGLSDLTRALDPTRPVISNDGWEHTDSDLFTVHDYEWRRDVLAARYTPEGLDHLLATTGPAGRDLVVGDNQRGDLPVILSEFGGVEFVTARSAEQTWGYSSATDPADYERRVRDIMEPVKASPLLGGYCWTQLTDTLQEANGLCDEHRTPKLPIETLKELMGS